VRRLLPVAPTILLSCCVGLLALTVGSWWIELGVDRRTWSPPPPAPRAHDTATLWGVAAVNGAIVARYDVVHTAAAYAGRPLLPGLPPGTPSGVRGRAGRPDNRAYPSLRTIVPHPLVMVRGPAVEAWGFGWADRDEIVVGASMAEYREVIIPLWLPTAVIAGAAGWWLKGRGSSRSGGFPVEAAANA
jgi:hypothetical protein